jgi:tetratricopeptide (TPR) repeat protein
MRTSAAAAGFALAALAACAAPRMLAAQEASEVAGDAAQAVPATADGAAELSPLAELRGRRDAFLEARDFAAALAPAEAVVAAQREQREPQYPADLAALGLIRAELGALEEAAGHLIDAIEVITRTEGEFSPTLVEYYRALGRVYIKDAKYREAIASLEQGQHISQRHLGLFNVEQSPLLDDITTAYLGLGDTIEARKMQIERLDNAIRRFGAADPRVIPYRYTLARYYERSRLPESAREQYQEVLKAQEARLGPNDAGVLGPLRELAEIDLLITQGADAAHRDRLEAVLEENADANPIERGLSLALLGDWATVKGESAVAADYYRRAWSELSRSPDVDVAAYFAKPSMIDFVPPLSPVDRAERRRPYTWAEIVFEFNVTPEGLPAGVRALTRDQQLSTLIGRYSRRLRETHFRPRLVNGEPVATTNVRSTHYVRRYVSRDEEKGIEN